MLCSTLDAENCRESYRVSSRKSLQQSPITIPAWVVGLVHHSPTAQASYYLTINPSICLFLFEIKTQKIKGTLQRLYKFIPILKQEMNGSDIDWQYVSVFH